MSDQEKHNETQEEAKELDVLDEAIEDNDLEDVSGGGGVFCADGSNER